MDAMPPEMAVCVVQAATNYGLAPGQVAQRVMAARGTRGSMIADGADVALGISRLSAQRVRHLVSGTMTWERIAGDDCLNIGLAAYVMAIDAMPARTITATTTVDACIVQASNHYGVPEAHFRGILAQEGGKTGMRNRNRNGSYDLGVGQINTIHLAELSKYGIGERELMYNDCLNVHVAAYRFRYEIDRVGGDVWRGVGNYHSRTPTLSATYRERVAQRMRSAGTSFAGAPR